MGIFVPSRKGGTCLPAWRGNLRGRPGLSWVYNSRMSESQGQETSSVSRRHLATIYGLWGVISAALGIPALIYLFFPPKARKEEQWVEATDLSQLEVGVPEEVVFRHNRVELLKQLRVR